MLIQIRWFSETEHRCGNFPNRENGIREEIESIQCVELVSTLFTVCNFKLYSISGNQQMISLEGISDVEDDVAATLALMAKVIRHVHIEVLCAKFGEFAKALDNALTMYQMSTHTSIITNVRVV